MLGSLVRSLADLSLAQNTRSAVRSLCTVSSVQQQHGLLTNNGQRGILARTGGLGTVINRTYFRPMDDHGRGETAADGYGITLFDEKGKRTGLKAVELRFKRLDWGMWIRPRSGRTKKAWKASSETLRAREKHVFCRPFHNRRFDRAVLSNIKEIRHIPEDPYQPYNDFSYQNYHSIKLKNMERIKKYGSEIYRFPHYRAQYKKNIIATDKKNNSFYEPPGYHKDVADGEGVYIAAERAQDVPAPNYRLEQRGASKIHRNAERRYWKHLKISEKYSGPLSQSHPLKLPSYGTDLG